MRHAWGELYLTIDAATLAIGPVVYAAGLDAEDHLVIIMERGVHHLKKEITHLASSAVGPEQFNATVAAHSSSLATLIRRTAEAGLILADGKPPNIIVMPDGRLRMIDFDPSFSALVTTASATDACIRLVNGLVIFIFLVCSFGANRLTTKVSGGVPFLKAITTDLRALLAAAYHELASGPQARGGICDELWKMMGVRKGVVTGVRPHGLDRLRVNEDEGHEIGEPSGLPNDAEESATTIMGMLEWYGAWADADQVFCGAALVNDALDDKSMTRIEILLDALMKEADDPNWRQAYAGSSATAAATATATASTSDSHAPKRSPPSAVTPDHPRGVKHSRVDGA
jgi:hypothetical protein